MKHLLLLLLTSILVTQCKKTTSDDDCCLGGIKNNFVLAYATLDSLDYNVVYDNGDVNNVYTSINNIRLEIKYIIDDLYCYNDINTLHKNMFETYAHLYKDTSFNKPTAQCFEAQPCMLDTISKIDVLCNKSYDDNHAAGKSLGDIVKITYCCAADYINNHYTAQYDSLINLKSSTLQEFNKNYNYLVGIGASSFLSFLVPPKESGEYIFTLKMYIKNGKFFIYNFKPILLGSEI